MAEKNTALLLVEISKEFENITDAHVKKIIQVLFNIIENQALTIQNLQKENQELKDENNRLKGEQGKPNIKDNVKEKKDGDVSSEKERKNTNRKKRKKKKKKKIEITKKQHCRVNKNELPSDAEFKDYVPHTCQDIKFEIENTLFLREKYYSQSTGKIYLGQLPAGHEGAYGPGVKTLILVLKNDCNVSEPNILKLLQNAGIKISIGTISNLLIKQKELFHEEKSEIVRRGIESSDYQQTDHSYTRVNGENWYTQILCNPLYTAFFTTERKTRLAVLEILLTGEENEGKNLEYKLNEDTISLLKKLGVSKKIRRINLNSANFFTRPVIKKLGCV